MTKGDIFARLTAIKQVERAKSGNQQWLFQCECGKRVVARTIDVTRGFKRSCGCLASELTAERNRRMARHGMFGTPEYNIWALMLQRCLNSKAIAYKRYGARGITVCERWLTFENFYADMGARPSPKHSIDRINNDGNYELANCRWATRSQQNKNKDFTFARTRPRDALGRYLPKRPQRSTVS